MPVFILPADDLGYGATVLGLKQQLAELAPAAVGLTKALVHHIQMEGIDDVGQHLHDQTLDDFAVGRMEAGMSCLESLGGSNCERASEHSLGRETLLDGNTKTVVLSWILLKSRAHRDRVNARVMKDPRVTGMCDMKAMPFDVKRMLYGGFKTLVEA